MKSRVNLGMFNKQGKNKDAQFKVAIMYLEGDGIRKNKTKGMHWMKEAIQNGNLNAMEYAKENKLLFD